MVHSGRCLCGQVTYKIDAEPVGARYCWCHDCQKIASGSATVNVLFPESAVQFTGDITTIEMIADSGNTVERGFCPKCGSQMYSGNTVERGFCPKCSSQMYSRTIKPADAMPMRVRAGTLDDPELMSPSAIIWADSAPGWAVLNPDLPLFPKGPPVS